MRKVREILRLSWGGKLSTRAVAQSCGIGRTTVREYLQRARRAGLLWPLPEGVSDGDLEALLFPPGVAASGAERPLPDWPVLHEELRRKGVTLFLLWEEYKAAHPNGYEYSRFCDLYRDWAGKLPVWMRQDHKAGEKLFVDYAGMGGRAYTVFTGRATPDSQSGRARNMQIPRTARVMALDRFPNHDCSAIE